MKRSLTTGAVCAAGALAAPIATAEAAPTLPTPSLARTADGTVVPPQMRTAAIDLSVERHVRVARAHARARGAHLKRSKRRWLRERLDDRSPRTIRKRTRSLRHDLSDLRERVAEKAEQAAAGAGGAGGAGGGAVPGNLQAIAACESGGDPSAVDASGTYRGKYQFDMGTWASVGGSGDPAAASEAEQDKRAAMLYEQAGAGRWPVCGS